MGQVNSKLMYQNVMENFKWGNMERPDVYIDENNSRMMMNIRNTFNRLAETLVQEGQKSGEIDEAEYKIIKNAFGFSEQTAKQVMVPRTQVFAIDINNFNETTIEKIISESYSRIPCYDDNLDNIVGVLYLKDLLIAAHRNESLDIQNIMRNMHVIPESKSIGQLLNEFQIKHQQMALVVNEYGGTEGIITMEDILEELVGEIQDEYDNDIPFVEKVGEKTYNVLASASLDDINDHLPHPIEKDKQYETLAGYLILKFGKIPSVKEKITGDNYEYSIVKRNKSSIILVQLVYLNENTSEIIYQLTFSLNEKPDSLGKIYEVE